MTLDNLSFDGDSTTAFWLGFAKGLQYNGLSAEEDTGDAELSNCFAAMYAQIESVDLLAYDYSTISSEDGRWKGFDVFVSDPLKILADNVVLYEMCEFGNILDQYKQMASLDYASLSDNVIRQGMVLFVDMPDIFSEMDSVIEAGKCATKVVADTAKDVGKSAID